MYKELSQKKICCLQLKFNMDLNKYKIPFDGHPNIKGAEETANQILKHIKQKES